MKTVGHTYTSIDIGSHEIKIVIAVYEKGEKFIIKHASCIPSSGINRGEIVDIEQCYQSINSLANKYKNKIGSVTINISSSLTHSINTHGGFSVSGRVKESDISSAIKSGSDYGAALEQHKEVFVHPTYFKLNHQQETKSPIGIKANYLQVFYHLIALDKNIIEAINNTFGRANIFIEQSTFSGTALSSFMLSDEQKRSGVCLIDIGSQTSDIIVFKHNHPQLTATLEFGGDDIDEHIAYHYDCELAEAKRLKEEYGCIDTQNVEEQFISFKQFGEQKFLSNYQLAEVIKQSGEQLVTQIKTILKNKDIAHLGAGFIFTGESTKLVGLISYMRTSLKNKVKSFQIDAKLLENNNLLTHFDINKMTKYQVALALLTYKENTEYLQESYIHEKTSGLGNLARKITTKLKSWEK
jgi:cell division protein FtsA